MPCFSPLEGYLKHGGGITFNKKESYLNIPKTVTCGQCSGCRLERSRQWATRCHHEASLHQHNCFITLTYADEHLPQDRSINVRVFQKFMKRLRKKYAHKIRFYACGEYGDTQGRPHYHACLFGHDFEDKYEWRSKTDTKETLYRSPTLEKLWPYGFSSIGEVTFQSAAYVARYIMKKINGPLQNYSYEYIDEQGEIHQQQPEFTCMSRKPGVGANWLALFASDVYPDDFVIINGKRVRPPRYYDQNYELLDPDSIKKIRWKRQKGLAKHADNNTPERLRVRQQIQDKKIESFVPRNSI